MKQINNDGALTKLSFDAVFKKLGKVVGKSEWYSIDQSIIDSFADLTKDHFFIHVDPERVKRETPFGSTIAHGFLSVSLLSAMSYDCVPGIEGAHFGLNYGFNKLRFVSPVPVNSRIRGHFTLKDIEKKNNGEITMIYNVIVELENQQKPVLAAEWVTKAFVEA